MNSPIWVTEIEVRPISRRVLFILALWYSHPKKLALTALDKHHPPHNHHPGTNRPHQVNPTQSHLHPHRDHRYSGPSPPIERNDRSHHQALRRPCTDPRQPPTETLQWQFDQEDHRRLPEDLESWLTPRSLLADPFCSYRYENLESWWSTSYSDLIPSLRQSTRAYPRELNH